MTAHYVDWSKNPEEFKWVAMDSDGSVYAFGAQPILTGDGWYEGGPYDCVATDAILQLMPAWEDSLIERPAAATAYHPAFFDAYADTPFGDWPRPAQVALFEAWLDGARLERKITDERAWALVVRPGWDPATRYRIAPIPATKPSIDWAHVAPEFKFLVRDYDGEGLLFKNRPFVAASWHYAERAARASAFASYRPGNCAWKDSFVERPAD